MLKPMMMTGAVAVALALIPSSLDAQELDGQVTQDPASNTATYDFHFNGPPSGRARLYLSLWMLDPPLFSPALGNIYLDPTFLFPVTPFQQLPPTGQLDLQFQAPLNLTAGLPLVFQSLNVDLNSIIRFSNNAVALAQNVALVPCNLDYAFAYDTKDTSFGIAGSGPVGATIEVRIVDSNGTRHTVSTTVGADGKFVINDNVPGGLTQDDDVMILCNGSLHEKIDLFKF